MIECDEYTAMNIFSGVFLYYQIFWQRGFLGILPLKNC